VQGGEEAERAGAEATYELLANGPLEEFRLGCLHGRLGPAEKEALMRQFRDGQVQVLVSTSVVEVGVDVPNATLMTIEDADSFGLAQLHQLRGRITRGAHPGYCCLFADPATDQARARLEAFVSSSDGFHLAEVDFQQRGPGEILGTRQHGLPPLRIADLARDGELLDEAREVARQLIARYSGLDVPQWARLGRQVLVRYGQALELGDVG